MTELIVREYEFGPGEYVDKSYSLDEIKEIFNKDDLCYVMAERIEAMQGVVDAARTLRHNPFSHVNAAALDNALAKLDKLKSPVSDDVADR